jgi:pantothenate kinase
MTTTLEHDADRVCGLICKRLRKGERIIVGIAGPPASGKSTLAEAVVGKLNEEAEAVATSPSSPPQRAVLLPMDGYHLDNCILEARGQLARKGASETFDSNGFCRAVRQLAKAEEESYHPRFDRKMDLAIACSIAVPPDVPVVVVEGNYLLLKSAPWSSLQDHFALTVFVCPSFDALRDRLQQRWIDHGLDGEAAKLRATRNDLPNARKVVEESRDADLHLDQSYTESGGHHAY